MEINGFERRDFVFAPGEFSIRGGIVDLFSFAHEFPFRIELDGDIIESIRTFDVNDQLSLKEIAHFSLLPNIQDQRDEETTISITDYFDPKTLVVSFDLSFQIEELGKAWEKALQIHQEAVDFGREVYKCFGLETEGNLRVESQTVIIRVLAQKSPGYNDL